MTVNIIYPAVDRSIKDRLRVVQRLTTVSKVPDEALSLFISRSSTLFANHKYKSCAVFSSVFVFFVLWCHWSAGVTDCYHGNKAHSSELAWGHLLANFLGLK